MGLGRRYLYYVFTLSHSRWLEWYPKHNSAIILLRCDNISEQTDSTRQPETIKLLEENIGKTLSDINHSNVLYDTPPRIMEIKAKINKWDLIKLKSFCTMKEL